MANTKIAAPGNVTARWGLPGWAANPNKPTVAEVNATLDVSESVSWQDFSFGQQASNTNSDPSITDAGNTQARGYAQFGGSLSFYYPRVYNNTADSNSNTFEAMKVSRTLGYLLLRVDGKITPPGTRIAINGDFWNIYKVISDGINFVVVGEDNYRYNITFQPQGEFYSFAQVTTSGTPAITASLNGGATLTTTTKKPVIAYFTGRQLTTLGYPSRFNFASSNTAIMTVDANGLARGVAAGSANITVTDPVSGVSATAIAVTVS